MSAQSEPTALSMINNQNDRKKVYQVLVLQFKTVKILQQYTSESVARRIVQFLTCMNCGAETTVACIICGNDCCALCASKNNIAGSEICRWCKPETYVSADELEDLQIGPDAFDEFSDSDIRRSHRYFTRLREEVKLWQARVRTYFFEAMKDRPLLRSIWEDDYSATPALTLYRERKIRAAFTAANSQQVIFDDAADDEADNADNADDDESDDESEDSSEGGAKCSLYEVD